MVNRSAPVFVWWAGKRGHAIHGADDWQVGPPWQLFSWYQDIFPCAHISVFFFFSSFFQSPVSYWQNAVDSDMHQYSVPRSRTRKYELRRAKDVREARCWVGQTQQEQQEHRCAITFFHPLTGKFQYFSIMSLYLHVWCVNDLYQPNVLECSSGATQLTVTIWLYYNPLGRLGLKVTPN